MGKFLETPELVEMLLPFLNAENTLALVQSGVINIKTLQGTLAWRKLIRRTIPSDKNPFVIVSGEFRTERTKWPPSLRS